MKTLSVIPAAISRTTPQDLTLSGSWTARQLGTVGQELNMLQVPAQADVHIDGAGIQALDTAGAWVLQKMIKRLHKQGTVVQMRDLQPEYCRMLELTGQHLNDQSDTVKPEVHATSQKLEGLGRNTVATFSEMLALLGFIGETASALAGCMAHPARLRWRPVLFNIRTAGFDALPIVGMLSFLLGIVVAYQGADQLRRYGASIFVADLVGFSMLREFAPLITAIIIAGRSGSAYAAQIGTMSVTEEIDAMRTIGMIPLDMLVLPKVIALMIALPLLTVYADVLGVIGGMIMANVQLDIGYGEFLDRFVKAVSMSTLMIGIGKAPVFAAIIVVVGCFQGFRTRGGADSVGRQTTRSVVQSIFLVIVADALFSIAFSALDL